MGATATVQIFDLKSNQTLAGKAADDADCISYDSASKNVLAFCGDAHAMIAILPTSIRRKKKQCVARPGVANRRPPLSTPGKVFVNLVDKNEVRSLMRGDEDRQNGPWRRPPSPWAYRWIKRKAIVRRMPQQKDGDHRAEDGHVLSDLPIGAGVDASRFLHGRHSPVAETEH